MSKYDVRDSEVQERRRFPRVRESCRINYRIVRDSEHPQYRMMAESGLMNNISGGGISFVSAESLAQDTMVALEVFLPNSSAPVISMGRVVSCSKQSDGSGFDVGVEFWWIGWKDELAQDQIRSFITDSLRSEKPR